MIDMKEYTRPLPLESRLRRQLQKFLPLGIICILLFIFTYTSGTFSDPRTRTISKSVEFPQKIWQTWRVNPLSLEQKEHDRALGNDVQYVETVYGPRGINRPDIVFIYKSITATIVKADILRYLIMYAEGGVYADVDVEALRPISRFFPERYNGRDIDMVVGVEIDQPNFVEHPILGKKCMSFCQWTFMCKPRLPVMLKLVENIMTWITEHARRQNVPISEVKLSFDDIIAGTGPSAFTEAILDDVSKRVGHKVTWDEFHNLAESKLIAGVLVLTVEAFAAGQGHSDSGTHDGRNALVKHHYHASGWPSSHPRFKHPYYGEVETCNWDPECIRQWDSDIAAFNDLPQAEKDIKLAVKQAKDEQTVQVTAAILQTVPFPFGKPKAP